VVERYPGAPDLQGWLRQPAEAATWWAPAHRSNWWAGDEGKYRGAARRIMGICVHTAEEPSDRTFSTPGWFQHEGANASTTYGVDRYGDVWQFVRERDFAWGQGVARRRDESFPPWYSVAEFRSFNTCLIGIELEGRAATIASTFDINGRQWRSMTRLCGHLCAKFNIEVDRDHIVGHMELTAKKADPGVDFPWAAFMHAVDSAKLETGRAMVRAAAPLIASAVAPHRHILPARSGDVDREE